jgi:ribosomal protein S18 acetylase RimI-like enzyme
MPLLEEVSLRPERPDDEAFLLNLYYSVREPEFVALGWPAEMLRTFLAGQFRIQAVQYSAAYPEMSRCIVEKRGIAAGRMYVARAAAAVRLVEISLLPEWRGRGIGSHLIGELAREAAAGGKSLRLSVFRQNPAMRLYRRLGFVETGAGEMYAEMEWASVPDVENLAG